MTNEVQDFRAQNLDFLRWRYGTHKHLQKKLAPILNWTELSNFALGQKRLPDYKARRIEEELKRMALTLAFRHPATRASA